MSSRLCFSRRVVAPVLLAMFASAGLSTAVASGSMSPGGGQGADLYNVGKSVFFKQVACGSCAYADRAKNASDAKALLVALKASDSKVKLDSDEMEAVETYLAKLFKLTSMGK